MVESNQSLYMRVNFIGQDIKNFYEVFKETNSNFKKILDLKLHNQNIDTKSQLSNYFKRLESMKDSIKDPKQIKEVLLIKLNSITEPEINLIIENMDRLDEVQYMPLVLILLSKEYNDNLKINKEEYKQVDQRFLIIKKYTEEPSIIEIEIDPILLRFFSIHNELGDVFLIKGEREPYKLVNEFNFNLNIACIGRTRQGKSTGVNKILQEYKSKESSLGCSQTINSTFYQVKDQPVRILDIPGFDSEKTVIHAVQKFKESGESLKENKDKIHIILYFINYLSTETFLDFEYPIIEEILNHESAKIIYIMTHSNPNMTKKEEENKIRNLNRGLEKIIEKKAKEDDIRKSGMFRVTKDNVIFVNFHHNYELNFKPFGIRNLFTKIYEYFIQSDTYKDSFQYTDKNYMNKKLKEFRENAKNDLFKDKIIGGLCGMIPIPLADSALQKFFIKKDIIKRVEKAYGFSKDEIDNVNKIIDNCIQNNKNLNVEHENGMINGKELVKEGIIKPGIYSGMVMENAGTSFIEGATKMVMESNSLREKSIKLKSEAKILYQLQDMRLEIAKNPPKSFQGLSDSFVKKYLKYNLQTSIENGIEAKNLVGESTKLTSESIKLSTEAAKNESKGILMKNFGKVFDILGPIISFAISAYFTHQDCENLLNEFENYKRKIIELKYNSYFQAVQYFKLNSNNN